MSFDLTNCTLIKEGKVFNIYCNNDSGCLVRHKKQTDLDQLLLIESWEHEFLIDYFKEHGLEDEHIRIVIEKIVKRQRDLGKKEI